MSSESTDSELLERMLAGEQVAFAMIFRRHKDAVYRFVLLRNQRPEWAADIVQDVFIGLLTQRFVYRAELGALKFFLLGVARNLLMQMEQQAHRFDYLNPDSGEIELDEIGEWDDQTVNSQQGVGLDDPVFNSLWLNQRAHLVQVGLSRLPATFREVIILYELNAMTYEEIAIMCEIPVGTVRSRLSRAKYKLAHELEQYELHSRQSLETMRSE